MREVRAEAAAVRLELDALAVGDGTVETRRAGLAARLTELRGAWRRLDAERHAARHRRMVLLGHEEEPEGDAPPPHPAAGG